MAASDIAARMTLEATAETKEHYKSLWRRYLQSIEDGKPVFYLPKGIADWLGNAAVEDMARRFGKRYENSMLISYDPQLECFLIGPPQHIDNRLRIFKRVALEECVSPQDLSRSTAEPLRTQARVQTPAASQAATNPAQISPVKPRKIPKPPNSWILYRKSKHAAVVAQNPGVHNSQISVIISRMWQNETAEVKASFKKKADDEKQRLLQEYPDWKCSPRKSSQIKKRNKSDVVPPNNNFQEEAVPVPPVPGSGWDYQVPGVSGTLAYYGLDQADPDIYDKDFVESLPVLDEAIAAELDDPSRTYHQELDKVSQFDATLQGFLL